MAGTTGAGSSSSATASSGSSNVTTRITEWKLSASDIQADLDSGAAIVRSKDTVVGAPTGSTDDSVIENMVKGKLQADAETSKAMIEVDANKGEVSLKGSAESANVVGRAMALALDTQGVTKVSSEVKVGAHSNK